jgi:signal transduction histidine kinase
MNGPRRRLFWRAYLNGLLLIVAATLAVTATTLLVQPESRFHGRPEHLHQILAVELARHLDNPEELQTTLDRFSGILERSGAIYRRDGTLLAASGTAPPPALKEDMLAKIGDWHPLRQEGRAWVYAVALGGGNSPYLLIKGTETGGMRFFLSLAAVLLVVALVSWPMVRAFVVPLERLTATSRALAGGDLSARSGIRRKDEVGELARALDDMAMRLEERIRSEKEMFANISHEIRTPLARLRVALELCEDAPADAQQTIERLQGMGADLAELERLVDNVLTSARLDLAASGPAVIPLRRLAIDLNEFFTEVTARFFRHHPDRCLERHIPSALPTIMADPELLNRVCDNLLENAVKYSEPGDPVKLIVANEVSRIKAQVADRGTGVQEEDLPHLFEPFSRSDRSRSRQTGGFGLGLTLCKRIIETHGGSIHARLNKETGMTFCFDLPVQGQGTGQAG